MRFILQASAGLAMLLANMDGALSQVRQPPEPHSLAEQKPTETNAIDPRDLLNKLKPQNRIACEFLGPCGKCDCSSDVNKEVKSQR